jgi:hypothetical protein
MPMALPCSTSQTTLPSPGNPVPSAPQQSLVFRQRSPFTWQPLAGWQTFTPVGPYGAQSRLQHPLQASQSVPSTPSLQFVAPAAGAEQMPSVAPCAMLQMPPQQSNEFAHVSPVWMQNDGGWQVPAGQYFEQQSPAAPHALPCDLQPAPGLIAAHLPLAQLPPQHSPLAVQARPSDVHGAAAHWPATQLKLAHCVFTVHGVPAAPGFLIGDSHV